MTTYTIGQLAKAAHVNVETIRYYARRGLLPPPPRRPSGYRQYSPDYLARIRFVKRAQVLGFSLDEIADLLALRVEAAVACGDVQQRTQAKLDEIAAKIQTLQRMHQALIQLLQSCLSQQPTAACPILDALAEADDPAAPVQGRIPCT